MDLLTDVLKSFHLQSSVLYSGCVSAPWGVSFAPQTEVADASFHVVTEGRCYIEWQHSGEPPLLLEKGDLVLLPYGHWHSLRDAIDTPVHPIESLYSQGKCDATGTVHYGGGGMETHIVCGKFVFRDRETNPLLRSLPPLIVVRGEQGKAVDWLEGTLAAFACELQNNRPGAETVISRLSDILFIHAIRAHMRQMDGDKSGWLRAMTDPEIAPALQALHQSPHENWTVERLARRACVSRSAFAARFTERMGEPPLHYLTRWRMHVAIGLLRDTRQTLAEIAAQVGYGSEAAFSKAFKRLLGTSPGSYRTTIE
jgi:AraC family transcriptional regulator, alkane utilization regulator